jgi:CelD/BcsL family acetyltransferase involved in cellulose biosynthesis
MFADTRRRRRRLAERGPVEYRSLAPDSPEAAALLPTLFRQKSRRWQETRCRDLFAEAPYREFYRRLTAGGLQGGSVHVSRLQAGDTVVAAHWGVVCRGCFYFLIVGRESGEWDFYSPGRLLIEDMVEESIATPGVGLFDFTAGDEGFKFEWSDRTLPLYEYLAPRSLKGAVFIAGHLLRQRLKRHTRLRNWVRRLKGKAPK